MNKNKIVNFTPVLALATVLSLGVAGNALACSEGAIACGNDCAADDGKSTCNWEISSSGKLTIAGSGAMKENFGNQIKEENNTSPAGTMGSAGLTTAASWGNYWNDIKSVEIGEGITDTGSRAFQGLTQVESVSIPKTLTTVGNYAFDRMVSMDTFNIPNNNNLTSMSEGAFQFGSSLGNENAQKILDTLNENNLANGTTFDISKAAFAGSNVTSINIPEAVNSIGGAAFRNDDPEFSGLTSITFDEGLTSIGNSAFWGNSISEIDLPNTLTYIDSYAFLNNDLTSLVLPDSLETVGQQVFSGNDIQTLTIPDSLTGTSRASFSGNPNLSEIIISDSVDPSRWYQNTLKTAINGVTITCLGDVDKCQAALTSQSRRVGVVNPQYQAVQDPSLCTGKYHWDDATSSCKAISESACNDNPRYYYNGNSCKTRSSSKPVTCANTSYRENDGYCDRIRYTPAEAAKVVKDNDNQIVITFKK